MKIRKLTVSGNARLADANANQFIGSMIGTPEIQEANAEHIVKCLNMHDEILQDLPLIIAQAYNALNMPNADEIYLREQIQKILKTSENLLNRAKG